MKPYGYVLRTGHGDSFRESLEGVSPEAHHLWKAVYLEAPVPAGLSDEDAAAIRDLLGTLEKHQGTIERCARHAKAIRALLSARLRLPEGWVSVRDRLPEIEVERHSWKESKRVIVWVEYEHGEPYAAFAVLDNTRKWNIDGHNGNWTDHVTHWMPFAAPTEGQAKPRQEG